MGRIRLSALFLAWAWAATVPCVAQAGQNEAQTAADVLKAVEACQHWASEPPEGGAAREREIAAQAVRYCTRAQNKAEAAYKRYPANGKLAAAILQLLDIYYFDASAATQQNICVAAARYLKGHPERLDEEGDAFQSQCPAQAQAIEQTQPR